VKTVFLRVLEADDKASALLETVREPERAHGRQRFEVDPMSFASVPRSPFAYWVSESLRGRFTELPPFEAEGRAARQGGVNGDDFRWLRLWMEAPSARLSGRYLPIAKGGKFSPFYADLLLQAWWDPGRDTFWAFTGLPHRPSLKPASFDFYFRPGLTWPRRTQGGLSVRAMPAGCIFADKGPAAFVEGNGSEELLALLAVTNCRGFKALIDMQMAFGSYEVGVLQRTPVPRFTNASRTAIASLARRAWSLKRSLDSRSETSHAFTLPAVVQVAGPDISARTTAWSEHVRTIEVELADIQAEIDERCFVLYGIDEADRRTITDSFGTRDSEEAASAGTNDTEADAGEDTDESESTADATGLAAELVSWAVGVAFGRFDMRLATGARSLPTEPEPFDVLPACSPGMLTGGDGLPLARPPVGYPLDFPEAGVLVDDVGHRQDLPTAVRAVFDAVFGADADRWWRDVAALLDPKGHDLRAWIAGSFFEHHLKRHSKSRRNAPILWQLGTHSGSYSVWLYARRLTGDTFFQLQNEVVGPKLTYEERQLTSLIENASGSPSAAERKEIAAREALVEGLRAMLDEIKRVAPLWNPNLDDGVVLTMAPLRRLVPQHKPWHKELESIWTELAAGKHDWAHLAMHLWPERVVPKCVTDRSLAIAHGLEDVFWVEGSAGKWTARKTPTRAIEELIRERSSPAVKAALKSLLEAPSAAGAGGRGRSGRRRAAASAAAEGNP
jgi:hypothetical protein